MLFKKSNSSIRLCVVIESEGLIIMQIYKSVITYSCLSNMIFGFRRAYSIFSADHLRHMTISNLFSKRTIIKCSRNKVATNREALHISLFYSPICDYPQRTSFVWWQQTMVWWEQTMVWREQTIVWRQQTIVWRQQTTQRSAEETEKCASRQQGRGEVHALTPHRQ